MNRIKIIKAITLSFVATFAVLLIEPVRIFAGMAALVMLVMLVIDVWRCYKKSRILTLEETQKTQRNVDVACRGNKKKKRKG